MNQVTTTTTVPTVRTTMTMTTTESSILAHHQQQQQQFVPITSSSPTKINNNNNQNIQQAHKQQFVVNMAMNEITFVGQHQPLISSINTAKTTQPPPSLALKNRQRKTRTINLINTNDNNRYNRRGRRRTEFVNNNNNNVDHDDKCLIIESTTTTTTAPTIESISETETKLIESNLVTEEKSATLIVANNTTNIDEDLDIKSTVRPSTSTDIDMDRKYDHQEQTKIVMPVMTEMQYLWQCTCYRNFTRSIRISARSLEHLAIIFRIWLQHDPKLLSSQLFDKVIAKKLDTVRSTLINTIMSIKALIALTPSSQSTKSYSDAKQSFDNHLMNKWTAMNDEIVKDHNCPGKHLIAKFDFVGQQGQEVFQTTFFLLMSEQENLRNLNTDLYINMSSKFIAYLEFFITIMRCRYHHHHHQHNSRHDRGHG